MANSEEKPEWLNFKTYLQAIHNAVGTNLFRNIYVKTSQKGEFDATRDGELSCAFFVSAILLMFGKMGKIHGTVASTIKDLEGSGWRRVEKAKAGDVLVWEKVEIDGETMEHIGFCVGEGKAISNSYKLRTPVLHDDTFAGERKIEAVYRMDNWEDDRT